MTDFWLSNCVTHLTFSSTSLSGTLFELNGLIWLSILTCMKRCSSAEKLQSWSRTDMFRVMIMSLVQEFYLVTDDDRERTNVCVYCVSYLLGLPITQSIINSTNQLKQKWTAWSKNHHQSPKSFSFKWPLVAMDTKRSNYGEKPFLVHVQMFR